MANSASTGGAVVVPRSVAEAVAALQNDPDASVLAGGTDLMVAVNAGRVRPTGVVALGRIEELAGWRRDDGRVTLGAGLTYTAMADPEFAGVLPALAQAARTVGSPQIRNAGTLGGNLGTASPAGDTLPVLGALDAVVAMQGPAGKRELPVAEFLLGPKRTALLPSEIVTAVHARVPRGPQEFLKVGTRNAMVIAVVSVALVVDLDGRTLRCAFGSAGPVPLRAYDAERWVVDHVDWESATIPDPRTFEAFGELVADATRPIDDHRSTAAYRRHAVGVCARRALARALPGESA